MKKLLFKWSELLSTFWFIPVIIIIASVFLSVGMVYIDGLYSFPQEGLGRFFFVNSSDSARSILSTISGAMMGVAGTVFSITLVALTLASSQFGPRLIKNFMYVRLNQVVLGAYVSTYLYCLLVLSAIKSGNDFTFIPSLSILVAIVAAIANIILLIIFIHQIAISIQADSIISEISDFISKQVETLFPDKMGDSLNETKIDINTELSKYRNQIPVKCPQSGYLQFIDSDTLMKVIAEMDSLLILYHRPGSHLTKDLTIGMLYSNNTGDEKSVDLITDQIAIGKIKTPKQDLEFSIHQMVEIAVRALSPGINDPYTAISCIDNLTATMSFLAQAKFPSQHRHDENGILRIVVDTIKFGGVLDAAFNQIRQFSGGSTAVIIRLMEAITTIYKFAEKKEYKDALIKHAEMVMAMGMKSIDEKNDLDDLTKRAKVILND